jgi:hypothetical protein
LEYGTTKGRKSGLDLRGWKQEGAIKTNPYPKYSQSVPESLWKRNSLESGYACLPTGPHGSKGAFHNFPLPWLWTKLSLQLHNLVLLDVSDKATQPKLCSYTSLHYCTSARKLQTRCWKGAALQATTPLSVCHPSSPFRASYTCLQALSDGTKDDSDARNLMAQSWDPKAHCI